jgi:outer membrane protein N
MLTGYGQWEYNVQANNTESAGDQAWTRLAFGIGVRVAAELRQHIGPAFDVVQHAVVTTVVEGTGIKVGDYGSFDYGRNYGVLYDVEGWTDMLPEFGGEYCRAKFRPSTRPKKSLLR